MLSGIAPATADPAEPPPADDAFAISLAGRIADTAEAGITSPEALSAAVSLPPEGAASLIFEDDGDLVATVHLSAPLSEDLRAQLQQFAEIITEFPTLGALTVSVAPEYLDDISEFPGILAAVPDTQAANSTASSTLIRTNDAPSVTTPCTPQPPAEAAAPLRVDLARQLSGADGTGVTIGIISDSFNNLGGREADVAVGALPGPGNPCGYLTPVEVLVEGPNTGSDEGRAMAQLVHTIAPGATMLFAAPSQESEAGMAHTIETLIANGATIIVDDLTVPTELFYQQGIVSAAITQGQNRGVAYFTSAGNATGPDANGAPVSSWSTEAYRPTACPEWLETNAATPPLDCLDFNPDPADATPYDTLTIQDDGELRASGSIGEALAGTPTAYAVQYYRADALNPQNAPTLIADLPKFHPHFPIFFGAIPVSEGEQILQVMVRYTANPDTDAPLPAVTLGHTRGGQLIGSRTFMGNGTTDRVGAMTQGHHVDGTAVSIASADWSDPAELRWYSSLGSRTLLFEPVTLPVYVAKPRLTTPIIIDGPSVAAVDGVATTFFGDVDENGTYRFDGTSAAAPIAAAVAALGQQHLGTQGSALEQLVGAAGRSTAQGGIVNPYSDFGFTDANVFGSGLLDACALLGFADSPGAACIDDHGGDDDSSGGDNDGGTGGTDPGTGGGTGGGSPASGAADGATGAGPATDTATASVPVANTGASSQTGWIVGGAIALTAVALALMLLARKKQQTPER